MDEILAMHIGLSLRASGFFLVRWIFNRAHGVPLQGGKGSYLLAFFPLLTLKPKGNLRGHQL